MLELLTERAGRPVSGEQARDGLTCLHRLSLITLDPHSAQRAVRVHALVQRATRDSLPADRLPVLIRVVADSLAEAWPSVERDTVLAQVLRANADAVNTAGGTHLWEPDAHPVLFRAGSSLVLSGMAVEAVRYYQRLHATASRHLGHDHRSTHTIRNHLAHWRGAAGDPTGASAALEELLADQLRVLGPRAIVNLTAATTSQVGVEKLVITSEPSPRSRNYSPTSCECWAPTTPIP